MCIIDHHHVLSVCVPRVSPQEARKLILGFVSLEVVVLVDVVESDKGAFEGLHTLHFILPDLELLLYCTQASLFAEAECL